MDDADVLALVNQIRLQLAGFARAIVTSLKDNKLSTMEGLQLGMQGMTLAATIATMLQGLTPTTRQTILDVLEHGEMSMPGRVQ